ncbi:MAG TPA: hypothetical protein VK968_05240, partial [Roseimicrobium sp.]|nr:hypothetical protein [Roseimicrobium sp.]
PGDLRQLSMFDSFGLQVATSSDIDMAAAGARFYMLVPKEIVPRGYATLNLEQFKRLTQALADERFINAPDDASRGISDWLTENMFEWRSMDVASAKVSDAFLADLRKSVRKAVFTPQQALELAQAKAPVEIGGQSWTAEKYRTKAEARLDKLADEMLLRESLYRFNKEESPKKWTAFHGLMLQHGVALSPQQILKLFNFYQQSDTHAAHLATWFKRVVEDAAKDKQGRADVGIPVISSSAAASDNSTGGTVKLTANVLVSELAPGRKVEAVIDWNMPQGGAKPRAVKVTLENGAKAIDREITVPPGISKAEVKARMIVKIEEPASARQAAPPGVNELFQGAPLPSPATDGAKVVREFTGRTVDAPLRFDPQAPKVELGFYKGSTSQEFQGVRVTAPKVDGIRNWQIYRARSTDGPWVLLSLSHFVGDTLLDLDVAKLVGRHTWYYAAIPRSMDQIGHRERNPDFSHWAAIAVEQVIPAPKLKVESLSRDERAWRHGSEEYRRDLEKKREEKTQNRNKELESLREKSTRQSFRDDERAYYRKEEQNARRRHALEDFTESRELLVSWELPEMRGVLQGVPAKDVYLHLFRATDPDGPFEKVGSYRASDQLSYPLSDSLAGRPYYYQARFYHRGLYFDWASASGTEPLIRRGTVNGAVNERHSMMRFEIGTGQQTRIRVEEAQFESKKEEFNPYFAAHGPEGTDEGRLAAFARDERQKLVQKFWEGRRQPRTNDERTEVETDLAKRLKQFDERAYPAFRNKAPMPGVRLGALIGRLVPFVKGTNSPAAVSQSQYFYIGRGTLFTAPQAGSIEVTFNWPDNFEYETATEVRVTAAYESLMQETPPSFGQPAWKRNTLPAGPDNNWSVEFGVQGWQPGPDQEVTSYVGSSAEGPWYSHRVLDKSGQIYRQTNIKPDQELWLRLKLRSVPKSTYRPTGVYLGETWSAPYPLRLGPQPLYLWLTAGGSSQLMHTTIFGRRGQTMQLQVTGQWDPFRVAGVAPYGPEGIPEETYRKFALQMQEKEKTMSADQLNSNRPGLLGVEMQGTGQATKATGGLQNLHMWLVRKDAMLAPDLPAGAVISQFTPLESREIQVERNAGFYQGAGSVQAWFPVLRNWTFTFPADGMVSLAANIGFSWVGRHNFYGEGQVKLD